MLGKFYHIASTQAGDAVLVQRTDAAYSVPPRFVKTTTLTAYLLWGIANNRPEVVNNLVLKNNLVPSMLEALRDLIFASGIGFFKREITDGKLALVPYHDKKLEDWSFETQLDDYLSEAILQYIKLGNSFSLIRYDAQKKWYDIANSDAFITRIGQLSDKNLIEHYVTSPAFFGGKATKDDLRSFSKFSHTDHAYNQRKVVTMHHAVNKRPGNPHYGYPAWWTAESWIRLANDISDFHLSGIKNGYNIKFLVQIPDDYFSSIGKGSATAKEQEQAFEDFSNNFSKWLAGKENVNKTLIARYFRGADGRMMEGIKIESIKNENADDAYTKVLEMANQGIVNAMGLFPTLAGVNPGRGNDSGSQVRVMADYQQHYRSTVVRNRILFPVQACLRLMGYEGVVAAFRDVQLTTLDANPTGAAAVINHGN